MMVGYSCHYNLRSLYPGRLVRIEPYWGGKPKAQLRLRRDVVNA